MDVDSKTLASGATASETSALLLRTIPRMLTYNYEIKVKSEGDPWLYGKRNNKRRSYSNRRLYMNRAIELFFYNILGDRKT